ncbi:MAG: hypothetical protein HY865_07770 [Chloroflexi bacterium]|nr:hypothetical protein [Chloroflexota bacterium]
MWRNYLQRIVLIAVAILAIKTGIANLRFGIGIYSHDEAVTIWDERLANLTALIPFERGFVGYVSAEDIPGAVFEPDDVEGEFVLTQYAIAPLILVRGAEQEWNLLNLDPESYEKWMRENSAEFKLVGSGGSVYLVKRVEQ